jgi:hypothetical protein
MAAWSVIEGSVRGLFEQRLLHDWRTTGRQGGKFDIGPAVVPNTAVNEEMTVMCTFGGPCKQKSRTRSKMRAKAINMGRFAFGVAC